MEVHREGGVRLEKLAYDVIHLLHCDLVVLVLLKGLHELVVDRLRSLSLRKCVSKGLLTLTSFMNSNALCMFTAS